MPSDKRMAALSSTELPRRGSTATTTGKALNETLDYISVFLQVRQSDKPFKFLSFSRQALKNTYGIENADPRQISIALSGLKPSQVLGSTSTTSIDRAFDKLMIAKLDPLQIQGSTKAATKTLSTTLGLLYRK